MTAELTVLHADYADFAVYQGDRWDDRPAEDPTPR